MLLFDERQRRRVDIHIMNANEPSESTKIENFGAAFTEIYNLRRFTMAAAAWETRISLLTARCETDKLPGDCPVTRISMDEAPRSS
jgi:hypothetical protein